MKKVVLFLTLVAILAGCGQSSKKAENFVTNDPKVVYVYYFRGKQHCSTCAAVVSAAKGTVEKDFASNNNVRFAEVFTSEKENEALVEKYEITWNALIVTKGADFVDITNQAFATAVGNPQALENLIKKEVNKRLQ